MQALNDEQQLERLEKRIDDGFAEMRAEFRAIHAEVGSIRGEILGHTRMILGLYGTMIFGFVGVIVAVLMHG